MTQDLFHEKDFEKTCDVEDANNIKIVIGIGDRDWGFGFGIGTGDCYCKFELRIGIRIGNWGSILG